MIGPHLETLNSKCNTCCTKILHLMMNAKIINFNTKNHPKLSEFYDIIVCSFFICLKLTESTLAVSRM